MVFSQRHIGLTFMFKLLLTTSSTPDKNKRAVHICSIYLQHMFYGILEYSLSINDNLFDNSSNQLVNCLTYCPYCPTLGGNGRAQTRPLT